jgi:hypothetical protein
MVRPNQKILKKNSEALVALERVFNRSLNNNFKFKADENVALNSFFSIIGVPIGSGISVLFASEALRMGSIGYLGSVIGFSCVSIMGLGMATIPLGALAYYLYRAKPGKNFLVHHWNLTNQIKKLPEGELKEAMNVLATDAEQGHAALWFRQAYRNYLNAGGFFSARQWKQAQKNLDAVGKKHGLSPEQRKHLADTLREQIDSTSLDDKIKQKIDQGIDLLAAHLDSMAEQNLTGLQGLPAPGGAIPGNLLALPPAP